MYQIRYQNGYEIQVIGKGNNGPARVTNSDGKIVKEAGYQECAEWLEYRGVGVLGRVVGGKVTVAPQ
jgi:hypothetical protein